MNLFANFNPLPGMYSSTTSMTFSANRKTPNGQAQNQPTVSGELKWHTVILISVDAQFGD